MDFEWDAEKARLNEARHGVSFAEASEVFGDDYSSSAPDPAHSAEEARYLIFGKSQRGSYLVVSFTERSDRIRVISSRRMTTRERKAYEQ